jgi:hypothetical protein
MPPIKTALDIMIKIVSSVFNEGGGLFDAKNLATNTGVIKAKGQLNPNEIIKLITKPIINRNLCVSMGESKDKADSLLYLESNCFITPNHNNKLIFIAFNVEA